MKKEKLIKNIIKNERKLTNTKIIRTVIGLILTGFLIFMIVSAIPYLPAESTEFNIIMYLFMVNSVIFVISYWFWFASYVSNADEEDFEL